MQGDRSFVPFRQLGQYEDIEIGLYYNRFRYYNADTGVYISQDPIGLMGNNPNFYGYTDSNRFVDVFGLEGGLITVLLQAEGSHFGVITNGPGGMMTDLNQLGDLGEGTNDYAKIAKDSDLYEFNKYANFEVDDIDAAKKMQLDEIARGNFKYLKGIDDCLVHVAKVLKAGGINIETTTARRFMMMNRDKFREIPCD